MNYRPGAPVPSAATGEIPISGAGFLLPEALRTFFVGFQIRRKTLIIDKFFLKFHRKFLKSYLAKFLFSDIIYWWNLYSNHKIKGEKA